MKNHNSEYESKPINLGPMFQILNEPLMSRQNSETCHTLQFLEQSDLVHFLLAVKILIA